MLAIDVLTLPAGVSLRRASGDCPGFPAVLARYPEVVSKDAAQSILSAAAGSRSGLLPHRTDIGCYAVVLITAPDGAPQVDTVRSDAGDSPPGSAADAEAHRMLAAHIDGMATKKQAQAPVIPVKGQLPLFPLPCQLPEPATTARPVPDTRRSDTAAPPAAKAVRTGRDRMSAGRSRPRGGPG